jgi:hypothetical protein
VKLLYSCKPIDELISSFYCKMPKVLKYGRREPQNKERDFEAI